MTLANASGPSMAAWLTLLLCCGTIQTPPTLAAAAAAGGESIFDNIINQLMSTAATAQNYLDATAGPQQSVREPSLASVDVSSSFLGNGLSTIGSYEENTPFWNPFTWLKPRAVSIPYNPDTDLTTVSGMRSYRLTHVSIVIIDELKALC